MSLLGYTWSVIGWPEQDSLFVLSDGKTLDSTFMVGEPIWVPISEQCSHSFVETGMRKSWCKYCNKDAVWNGNNWEATK